MLRATARQLLICAADCEAQQTVAAARQLTTRSATSTAKGSIQLQKQLQALKRGQLPVATEALQPAASAPGEAAGEAEQKSWLPKWLDFLSPGKKDAKDDQPKGIDWKDLSKVATNFEVDAYRQLCYNARTASPPPRPRIFKKPLNSRIQYQYTLDSKRVSYLRTAQHERIASNMTAAQKAAVKADCYAVLADRQQLQDIATTTGFSVPEVADCLQMYNRMKARVSYLYRWQQSGRKMPNSKDEIDSVVQQLQRKEEQELKESVVSKRDRENCPLEGRTSVLGKRIICPLTEVHYFQCCGAKQ